MLRKWILIPLIIVPQSCESSNPKPFDAATHILGSSLPSTPILSPNTSTPSHVLNSRAFSASSTANIAVYFGQTPITGTTSLAAQCSDPLIDIAIIAFVISYTPSSSGVAYPTVNFGAACGGQTAEMAALAPGLLQCEEMAADIQTCQRTHGKKVLLSIGGATAGVVFSTDEDAKAFADVLWRVFGPLQSDMSMDLRPFGTAVVDGFDFDNENNNPQHYATVGSSLRTLFRSDSSKPYFLSSAPQCPFPDASNPLPLLLNCDFVFVQFYNNAPCEVGSAGFLASVRQWSTALAPGSGDVEPKLYIGMPAFAAAGASAYAGMGGAEGVKGVVEGVKRAAVGNLGGIMFWDGPQGRANIVGGKSIFGWAREGLGASGGANEKRLGESGDDTSNGISVMYDKCTRLALWVAFLGNMLYTLSVS